MEDSHKSNTSETAPQSGSTVQAAHISHIAQQVSSLSESEESQDSSDSIGSSQKTHGILARRPSYRLVLMYQILCVLYYLMSLNGIIQSKLHQEGTCVCIRRHVLREIGLSQVMTGPCCCPKEEFRLTFWQSIIYLYLLLVNFNSNLKGL